MEGDPAARAVVRCERRVAQGRLSHGRCRTDPDASGHLEEELQRMGPWTALEKKSAFLMLLAVGLWMTDFWHHTPAPLIGLGIYRFYSRKHSEFAARTPA